MSHNPFGSAKGTVKITEELLKELTVEDGPSSEYDLDLRSRKIKKITCLGMLPKLRSVNLAYNDIGRIENIEKLAQLQKLQLFCNKLSNCDGLSRNVNLKILFLHENQITEIDEGIGNLVNLEILRLGRNKIKRIQNLKACLKLSSLDMCHNCLTTTEGLPPLVTLRELNLSSNQLTDIKSIGRCNNLREIDVSFNKLDTLLPLKRCKKLKQLNASGNNIATFKVLPTLPQLRELYLNDNDLSSIPKSFNKRFPVLDVLELMQNDLTEIRALLPLAQSKNLCELSVADNKFCQQIDFAAKVAKKLPSLNVLDGDVIHRQDPGASKAPRPTSAARGANSPRRRREVTDPRAGAVTPRRREAKSPRPGTASRSRPTLKSAHGRRTAKAAMLRIEQLDSKQNGFRSLLTRLRENVKGLDRLCSRDQLAAQLEQYRAEAAAHAKLYPKPAAIAEDSAAPPRSSERVVVAPLTVVRHAEVAAARAAKASSDDGPKRPLSSSGGMLRNALQFAKQKPKSQFHYRNKADRQVSSPRSTGSADVDMLMLSAPVPQQVRTMKAPQVDASASSSSEGRPNSAPSEVQSHDAEDQVIRFVNIKTADKRKPARKNRGPRGRGRGLRRFKIPKSVKQALSNEIL